MNKVIVFSRFKNLTKELNVALPHLNFQSVDTGIEPLSKNSFYGVVNHKITSEKIDQLQQSEIIISDFDLIAPYFYHLPKLKWLQGTLAGVDRLFSTKIDVNKLGNFPLVTRFTGRYTGKVMSEYVLGQIIAQERDFFRIYEKQKEKKWSWEGRIFEYRPLNALTIGIMGVGNIGQEIAKSLHFMGCNVLGFGNKDALEKSSFLSEFHTVSSLPIFLNKLDYIVNVLPSTSETRGFLNGNVLKNCKEKSPVFINIGRGTIIQEKDLLNALSQKWLSHVILDVFEEEPCPNNSKLWTDFRVRITPHVSGVGNAKQIAQVFKENWKLYDECKPMNNVVDLIKGY